jgi:hypothetical protein
LENIKEEELHTRLREQQYKLAKRDDELEQLGSDVRIVSRDNELLKEKYENLIVERNALKQHSDRIIEANKEIEKELDSFVNLDDSIVGTLERRDRHLSPIISQIKPPTASTQNLQVSQSLTSALRNHNPNAAAKQNEQANEQPAYGLQQSRMFDLRSAEQAKISPYSQTYENVRGGNRPSEYSNGGVQHNLQPQLHDLYKSNGAAPQNFNAFSPATDVSKSLNHPSYEAERDRYQSSYLRDIQY